MLEWLAATARIAGIAGVILSNWVEATVALELITPQEAALPDADGLKLPIRYRGVTRGPKVVIVSPAPEAGAVRSPLNFVLKFESHGGAAIDPSSIAMTYLKKPALNLTSRISPVIKPTGIDLPSAEIPPGTHYIRIEVKDDEGRIGSTTFALTVIN